MYFFSFTTVEVNWLAFTPLNRQKLLYYYVFVRGGGGDVEVSQVAGVRSLFWFALMSRLEQGASKIRWSGFFDSTF